MKASNCSVVKQYIIHFKICSGNINNDVSTNFSWSDGGTPGTGSVNVVTMGNGVVCNAQYTRTTTNTTSSSSSSTVVVSAAGAAAALVVIVGIVVGVVVYKRMNRSGTARHAEPI